jgi:hypothetical protein
MFDTRSTFKIDMNFVFLFGKIIATKIYIRQTEGRHNKHNINGPI